MTFSKEEKAAMHERARELKLEKTREAGEKAVFEKIQQMSGSDHLIASRLHSLINENAPELMPRTWYGMPAWAKKDKIVLFFQPAEKFGYRYATIGFQDEAMLDQDNMWPTSYAIKELDIKTEKEIRQLILRAVGRE